MNFIVTKELLFNCFDGRATALQKQLIDDWARQPENEEFFYKCLVEWELAHPQYPVDVLGAIDKYRTFVATQSGFRPPNWAKPMRKPSGIRSGSV